MLSQKKIFQKAQYGDESASVCGEGDRCVVKTSATVCCPTKETTASIANSFDRQQSGVVLVISLIMLLLLTLIGLSGMQSTILEEKMAGNMRDRNRAFQAAEAALKDGERHIIAGGISGFTGFSADCGAATADTTDNGLCQNGVSGAVVEYNPPVWENPNVWDTNRSVEYGSRTGARNIDDSNNDGVIDISPALSAQPRYIIEAVLPRPGIKCDGTNPCYRVTARAQGVNANTVVVLQTIYKPS